MNRQEVYNKVRDHLLAQEERSMKESTEGDSCAYRGEWGRQCAIGCLIPDERYTQHLEGLGVFSEKVQEALAGVLSPDCSWSFLCALQKIHDIIPPQDWKSALERVALANGLIP